MAFSFLPSSLPKGFSSIKYRPDIDGLRAVAVLGVVIFHAFPELLPGGFVGVDIFFAISGYLISSILFKGLQDGNFSFAKFYAHRIRRIFPALILVFLACFAAGWLFLLPDEYARLGKHIAAGAGFAENFILRKEAGYFDIASELKPLLHLWSLAIEEQFYLVYPLLLWLLWRGGFSLLSAVIALAAISFGLNIHYRHIAPESTFYFPWFRFWELLAGAALAYIQLVFRPKAIKALLWAAKPLFLSPAFPKANIRQTPESSLGNALSLLGFCLVLPAVFFVRRDFAFPGYWAALPVIGSALVILAGPESWLNRKLLANRLMVSIGLVSYPLYLWHWPLLSFARIVGQDGAWVRAGLLAASLVLAALTWRFVEKPLRFGGGASKKITVLAVSMLAIGMLGFGIHKVKGVETYVGRKLQPFQADLKVKVWKEPGCLKYFGLGAGQISFCGLDKEAGQPAIAFLGDSHANASYPGLKDFLLGRGMGIVMAASSGCLMFADASNGKRKNCSEGMRHAVVDAIAKDASIKKVFFIARTQLYLQHNGFGIETRDAYMQQIAKLYAISPEKFIQGIQETADVFIKSGKKVYLVTENPELGFNPASCLSRDGLEGKPCGIARQSVLARQQNYLQLFGKLKGVAVIDSLKAFCDGNWCFAAKGGKLLYADDDHLSASGSRFQVEALLKPYLLE
jgi:peptidoglycan/LPS O-acetylase OafA/YrhL